MREIIFRGKRLDNGEWAEGFLVHRTMFYGEKCDKWIITEDRDIGPEFEVDKSTVGQYTNLTDKNGKRIFEGDIIKSHYANAKNADFIEQVVLHYGRFCGLYQGGYWSGLPDGVPHIPQDKTVYMEWCEVIGNVFDDQELLEG